MNERGLSRIRPQVLGAKMQVVMGLSSAFIGWVNPIDPRTIHDEMRLRRWRTREGTGDQGLAFGRSCLPHFIDRS